MPIIVSCNFYSYFLLLSVAARAFDLKFFILKQQQPNNIIKPAVSHCSRKFFSLSLIWGVQQKWKGKNYMKFALFVKNVSGLMKQSFYIHFLFFLPYIHSLTLHTL